MTIRIDVQTSTGGSVALDGASLTFRADEFRGSGVMSKSGTVDSDTDTADFDLSASDTDVSPGRWTYEIRMTDGAGDIHTVKAGEFTVLPSLFPTT